jgi:hypothetical protein
VYHSTQGSRASFRTCIENNKEEEEEEEEEAGEAPVRARPRPGSTGGFAESRTASSAFVSLEGVDAGSLACVSPHVRGPPICRSVPAGFREWGLGVGGWGLGCTVDG